MDLETLGLILVSILGVCFLWLCRPQKYTAEELSGAEAANLYSEARIYHAYGKMVEAESKLRDIMRLFPDSEETKKIKAAREASNKNRKHGDVDSIVAVLFGDQTTGDDAASDTKSVDSIESATDGCSGDGGGGD